jgi:hypothetical protein
MEFRPEMLLSPLEVERLRAARKLLAQARAASAR